MTFCPFASEASFVASLQPCGPVEYEIAWSNGKQSWSGRACGACARDADDRGQLKAARRVEGAK